MSCVENAETYRAPYAHGTAVARQVANQKGPRPVGFGMSLVQRSCARTKITASYQLPARTGTKGMYMVYTSYRKALRCVGSPSTIPSARGRVSTAFPKGGRRKRQTKDRKRRQLEKTGQDGRADLIPGDHLATTLPSARNVSRASLPLRY